MRPSALVREAARNILSGTTRFVTFGLVLSALASGLSYADVATVSLQIDAANRFRDSGSAVLTLSAPHQIDGAACQALGHVGGVQRAGAMRESSGSIVMAVLPGAPVPEYEVTRGFADLLSASPIQGAGLILSEQVAQPMGASVGGSVDTARGRVQVAATYDYPSDGRRAGFGYAALTVTDDRKPFDECWVEAWPQVSNLRALLFTTLISGSGSGAGSGSGSSDASTRPSISQLNGSLGEAFSGDEQYFSRITRYGAPLMFLLGLGIGFISIRVRRLQFASALHSGVAKRDLVILALMESVAWAFPSSVIAAALAVAFTHSLPSGDGMPLLLVELGIPLAALCGIGGGVLLGTTLIRERLLFRFFKDR